jgi:molybdate transport system ATP-binding protein
MIVVSHDLTEILELTDQLMLINAGSVLAGGRFLDLAKNARALEVMHHSGLLSRFRLRVEEIRPALGWSRCRLPGAEGLGAEVRIPPVQVPIGTQLSAVIGAEDIALATRRVDGVSIQNQLPGTVRHITQCRERVICHVNVGANLLVEITGQSVDNIGVYPGARVWCLFKAHAVRVLPTAGS